MADVEVDGGETLGLWSLLSSGDRDFLVRNNGNQVKVADLTGKTVGLYFSAHWCGPCRQFTPKLVEVHGELSPKDFEIVFVSGDEDDESFNEYFSEMPWLAIPFSDSKTRDRLDELFKVRGIPHLVLLDGTGKILSHDGVRILSDYGSEGYPFTEERIRKMKEDEEAAKRDQTLKSVLTTPSRDYVITNSGNKVPVSELEGKTVCVYFSMHSFRSCSEFTPILANIYGKLKERGEGFEVVLVSLDDEEASFKEGFENMPWFAIPFKDKCCERLVRYFELKTIPTLVVIGPDGKTLNQNVTELVEYHGVEAYPFTPEKVSELMELEKARLESQTLESLLVSGKLDFVIRKGGVKVPVSELVGKNILLYFSAQWCPPCRAFLPKLVEAYHEIKAKDNAFEVIFISSDRDHNSFEEFFSSMPWLALPFGDERKKPLSHTFKVHGIPSLIAIGPSGQTVTKDARELVMVHGPDAYPFTEEQIKELEAKEEEKAKGWPKKLKHELHEEHELTLIRRVNYTCDACASMGNGWSFYCDDCDFDLHPKCALKEEEKATVGNDKAEDHGEEVGDGKDDQTGREGYVCDGEVCYNA